MRLRPGIGGSARAFLRDETGAGAAMGLFGMALCIMLMGVAVDFGNAWRQREVLRLSADVASHAGAGILARGGPVSAAMVAATAATEFNTPERRFGRVLFDPVEDIRLVHYDPASNLTTPGGPVNAVAVRLQRGHRTLNAVPTFFLGLAGIEDWSMDVESVAAVVPTERCQSSDGIFAHQAVTLEGRGTVGAGVCLHSQTAVALLQSAGFAAGAQLSMPDMARCGGMCGDNASPGAAAASASANLVMPEPADHITRIRDGFADPRSTLAEETAFFAAHPLAEDLSALEELGVPAGDLATGDVVRLRPEVFARLRALPEGLVYDVPCSAGDGGVLAVGAAAGEAAAEAEALSGVNDTDLEGVESEAAAATAAGEAGGETGGETGGDTGAEAGAPRFVLDGVVLLTGCALRFTASAELRGALVISTATGPDAVLTAEPGATAGDTGPGCRADWQTVVMALGAMAVPAAFTASNAAFVIAGPVSLGPSATGDPAPHRGLALHAGGPVMLQGAHAFAACGTGSGLLLPTLDVIKYVLPTDPLVTQ